VAVTAPSPQICPDCNGAGGDNNTFCCQRCNGSGGIITVELGIPAARKVIFALHDKEVAIYEKTNGRPDLSFEAYIDIEAKDLAGVQYAAGHKLTRLENCWGQNVCHVHQLTDMARMRAVIEHSVADDPNDEEQAQLEAHPLYGTF